MKKILLFTENLGSGGAERQLCGLAILLHQRGYCVKVVTYLKADFTQFYEPFLRNAGVDYELHIELTPSKTRIWRFSKIAKAFNPDVMISFLPSPNLTACAAKLLCGYKLIVGERNTNLTLERTDRIRFNIYRLANAIVPNSFSQGEFITKHYPGLAKKVYPIVNFVDVEKFQPAFEKSSNDVFNIVTVARYTTQKNYLNYAEGIAIAKSKGYKFHCDWFGNNYHTGYFESLLAKIKELCIEDYVTVHAPSSQIVKEYHNADALCLPSIYEGYPNVLCEAMSCGLPVICSNVVEMLRIVKDAENGYLFDPYNPESIADAIARLLNTSEIELADMSKTNRAKILRNNTEDAFVEKYIELINESAPKSLSKISINKF